MAVDPTFADHARNWLRAIYGDHHEVTAEDLKRDGSLIPGHCLCGDPLADGVADHLLDKLAESVAEPETHPHRVHIKNAIRTVGDGTVYAGPVDCLDCTRGLVSRGPDGMICSTLSRDLELKACHPGCLIACGVKRG